MLLEQSKTSKNSSETPREPLRNSLKHLWNASEIYLKLIWKPMKTPETLWYVSEIPLKIPSFEIFHGLFPRLHQGFLKDSPWVLSRERFLQVFSPWLSRDLSLPLSSFIFIVFFVDSFQDPFRNSFGDSVRDFSIFISPEIPSNHFQKII